MDGIFHWALEPKMLSALAAVYLLWGTSYLAIKQAGSDFPPLLLVGLRNLLAGVLLLGFARWQGRKIGGSKGWRNATLVGVLMISIGAALLAKGLQHVASSTAAILFAAVPMLVCILMAVFERRVSWGQWLGTGVGVAGLFIIDAGPMSTIEQQGLWWITAAVFATAGAAVLTSRVAMPRDVIVSTGIQMLAGGATASILGLCIGERISSPSPQSLVAFFYLSMMVSVCGYASYMYLVTHAGPVVASSYAYVNPPVALLAGAWILDEAVSSLTMLSAVVVFCGAVTVLVGTPRRSAGKAVVLTSGSKKIS